MKLGDLIRDYREQHDLSQRQFAVICGLSNGYISMLERGENPKTHKPVTPTLPQLKKLADGMGTTIMDVLDTVEDMPIDLTTGAMMLTGKKRPPPQMKVDAWMHLMLKSQLLFCSSPPKRSVRP